MPGRALRYLLAAAILGWSGVDAVAVTPFIDSRGQDPDAICHGTGSIDQEALRQDRAASVFTVLVTDDGNLKPNGTATLVDGERGIFLTAAHVVHFYRDGPMYVSQNIDGPNNKRFSVHVFPTVAATDDWKKEDVALLEADQWTKTAQILPFPFRLDAENGFIEGFFIGQAEDMKNSVFGHFGIAFGDDKSDEMKFTGTVFPRASGALLLDARGRAFGVILRDAEVDNKLAKDMNIRQLRRILWESYHFSAFPLRPVLDKLKAIPASDAGQLLIEELNKNGDDDEFSYGLKRSDLTAIDTLTDTIVSRDVWERLASSQSGLSDILYQMTPVVQSACTHKYFADRYAERFRTGVELPALPTEHAALSSHADKKAQNSPPPTPAGVRHEPDSSAELLRQIDGMPPDAATKAGMLFLETAFAAGENRQELASVQAHLAPTLLRHTADNPEVQRAINASSPNRDYAALMANIALAEDLVGDREAARRAILSADALGGSPAAYSLAAHYALVEHDPVSAAGLYARAYAMLSNEDPDGHLRASVASNFSAVAAAAPSIGSAKIAEFDVRTVARQDKGRWYALAEPHEWYSPIDVASTRHGGDISGAGGTFAYPIYAKWASAYKEETGLSINYQSIGSGGGIKQIKARSVTFGASDAPLKREDLDKNGLLQFPIVLGGIVPVVNLEGVNPGDLVLDGPTLAKIFMGNVKTWDDPAIKTLNPDVKLPTQAITVVHRSNGSGTTFNFAYYLSQVSDDWRSKVGFNTSVEWPVGIGAKGNEGVANTVAQANGSIGFVEYAYALQNNLAYTRMINEDGKVVAPTGEAFQAAAANADWNSVTGFGVNLANQPGASSWPMTAATFILIPKRPQDPGSAAKALKFFSWAYANGGKMAEDLDYVPIPDNVVHTIKKFWATDIKLSKPSEKLK